MPERHPGENPRTIADFYARTETAHLELNPRLDLFLSEYREHRARLGRPARILDIGCGRRGLLSHHVDPSDSYVGCDIVEPQLAEFEPYAQVDLNAESLRDRFEGPFDVIFCGEVVEHLFNPDSLLEDAAALLTADGLLLVSTPNLAYLLNRLLLLAGISPFFLENSGRVKLGRRTRLLGQGNETQGHIRLFTYRAMLDLIELLGLEVKRTYGVPVWSNLLDRTIARLSPSVAPDVIYVVQKHA